MGSHNEYKGGICTKEGKMYPLSREEQEEMHEFIAEQLRKGYIRLSKVASNSTSVLCGKEGW